MPTPGGQSYASFPSVATWDAPNYSRAICWSESRFATKGGVLHLRMGPLFGTRCRSTCPYHRCDRMETQLCISSTSAGRTISITLCCTRTAVAGLCTRDDIHQGVRRRAPLANRASADTMNSVRPAVTQYRLAYRLQRSRNERRRALWNHDFSV